MPAVPSRILLLGALLAATAAQAAPAVQLSVDATDLDHRILQVRETLAVRPGPLTLYFPRWLPGHHSPTGDVSRLAGLKLSTDANEPLAWTRDTVDTHAFKLTAPPGTERLKIEFQYLSAVTKDSGRRVLTAEMMNLQWNDLVLYPAGLPAREIETQATLKLPPGWQWAGALRAEAEGADGLRFKPVSLETLVDSPLFAGRHLRRIELDPAGTARPVVLNLVADRADLLKPGDPQIEAHRNLVRQADRLFGARHFAKYDFLLALSDTMGGIGLEHHESSENGVKPDYWERWDKRIGARELLPHEYTHSWNGKFRRPADLSTPDYNSVPMQNSLLWVYEGQTQFWGWVLMARSGLSTAEQARQRLALNAASYQARTGRAWRNLQDTTNDPIVARSQPRDWRSWQRSAGDYYGESLLIWLDADSLVREKSGGQRSMDDFARAFFGVDDGLVGPRTYTFDEVVATLNRVQPHDWATFLRTRLDGHGGAPLDGLARGGWKLAFTDQPSDETLGYEADEKVSDLTYSLGLEVAADGKLNSVQWGSPAFDAGLSPGLMLLAVNRYAYKPELLKSAIAANADGMAPIELLLRDGDLYRSVRIDYRGGLRYPRLERIAGSDDRLSALLAPR